MYVNSAGIEYAKLKTKLDLDSYETMNLFSEKSPIGSKKLIYLPFGNGSERMLNNKNVGSKLINYNKENILIQILLEQLLKELLLHLFMELKFNQRWSKSKFN